MTKKEAYEAGRDIGYEIAMDADFDDDMTFDEMESEAYEIEENARQFSPWEFLAHDINSSRYPDELWEEYDRGVSVGVRKGLRKRFRQ